MKKINAIYFVVVLFVINCGGGPAGVSREALVEEFSKLRHELTQQVKEKSELERRFFEEHDVLKKENSELLEREKQHLVKTKDSAAQANKEGEGSEDPLARFKRESLQFVSQLGPRKLFGKKLADDCQKFRQRLATLADKKNLFEQPMHESKPLTLPLPLVFDIAPKTPIGFTVYVGEAHGEFHAEKDAKFILATDDEKLVDPITDHKYSIPAGFPVLYLGNSIFMLPKTLLDPLYTDDADSTVLIKLEYDFENKEADPNGYETYIERRKVKEDKVEESKNAAAELRQRKLDEKLRRAT